MFSLSRAAWRKERPPRPPSEAPSQDTVLEFKNVSLIYQKAGEESLTDISFRVKRGQTVGVIGGTGSGKTSLVSLIPRFYDATKEKCCWTAEMCGTTRGSS